MENAADFINADYVKIDGILRGTGMVYGLYDEGRHVTDEIQRRDRRGARSALNLSTFEKNKFHTCLKGAEFAEFNKNLTNPQGIDFPLLNKYRESSVYIQTVDPFPSMGNDNKDWSFNVGGLDHEYQTSGNVWYGTLKRFNTQMYGNIESLQYADIGLRLSKDQTSKRLLVGDTFVQKWSDKRSAFVSDKVGNILNTDLAGLPANVHGEHVNSETVLGADSAHGGLDRSICEYPNRRGMRMKDWLGFFNRLQLPENGDKRDPKNMANGHPTRSANEIQGHLLTAETDLYYPRTLNHLNHLFVETSINLFYRSTSEPETREVFYEELQGLEVDSSISNVDPEDAWLNDWYNLQLQPSKKQQIRKAQIRFFVAIVLPAILASGLAGVSTSLQLGTTLLVSPFFGALYLILVYNIFSNKKLERLLGFPECKTDKEGAQEENNTRGLKDNWNSYNSGFSAVNNLNFFIGMPALYNTCKCTELSNVIYSSNAQIDSSPYDAYSNFQALSYTALRGDRGQLQLLFSWDGVTFAQMTDGLIPLHPKRGEISSNLSEQLLGSSAWYESPVPILDGVFEGYGGTTDPNATIICKYGVLGLDYESRDIRLFNGSFKSLADQNSGMYHYWQDNVTFCNSGCRDQLVPNGVHYALGYDPEHELVLITKHDGDSGVTFSYHPATNSYISEHSYIPDFYFWDRNKLFSVKDGSIYRHNMEGAYTTYYGDKKNVVIDVIVRAEDGDTFTYSHSTLDTEVNYHNKANRPDLFDREETFKYVSSRNEFQQTGKLPIVIEDQLDGRKSIQRNKEVRVSRRNTGKWQFDALRSNEIDRDDNVIILNDCGKVESFNEANVTFDKNAQETKIVKGKFLHHRFEWDQNDKQIILFALNTH